MLLLCMARPELLEKRPAWGGGKWNATTVLLEPLDAEETNQLLDSLGGVSAEMRERIRTAAEGNPLFVEEMLALLRESGAAETVTIPPTIQALLAARLDQLAPDERSVLERGAVEGRVFHRGALRVLTDAGDDVRSQLVRLVRKELVRPDRTQFPGDEAYRFRHLLIRDAAYDALPKAVRAELHERFAGWLDEHGTTLPELDEIAGYHLEQAARYARELGRPDPGLAERAGERLAAAGRRAGWRGDERTSSVLLEHALALLRPLRLDVDLELHLISLQPSVRDQAVLAEDLAERAAAAGDRPGEAVARVVAANYREEIGTGSPDDLESLALEAIPLLETANDHAGLARVWGARGIGVANFHGHFDGWAQAVEQAIFHDRQLGRPGLRQLPYPLILGPRPADEALQTLDPLLGGETDPGSRAYRDVLVAMLGRFEEARSGAHEAYRRQREVSSEQHGQFALARIGLALAEIASLEGDHEAAVGYLRDVCSILEKGGWSSYLSTYAPMLGRALCMLGRYDEAEPLAQQGRELGDEHDVATQIVWRQVQGLVLASHGEYEEAELLARDAVAIAETTDALNFQGDTLCDLATVLESAGRREEALAALEEALERYQRKHNLARVAQVRQRLGVSEHPAPLV
jgi:tetratricopeptide (TPR) repeat protein